MDEEGRVVAVAEGGIKDAVDDEEEEDTVVWDWAVRIGNDKGYERTVVDGPSPSDDGEPWVAPVNEGLTNGGV